MATVMGGLRYYTGTVSSEVGTDSITI